MFFPELQRLQKARGKPARLAFLDIKGAYDSVARDRLWRKCADHGVQRAALDLLQGLFDRPEAEVLVGRTQTGVFPCSAGVQQGSSLSPWLYTIFMNDLISALQRGGHGIALDASTREARGQSRVASLFFADDIVLTGRDWADLTAMLNISEQHAVRNRYRFGIAECEVLEPEGPNRDPMPELRLAGQRLKTTPVFTYLGLPVSADGINEQEWKKRAVQRANGAAHNLRRLGLHRRGFSWQGAVYLYKTFVRPCMEYGLALIRPKQSLLGDLDRIQLQVLREAARARPNTSSGVLLRLAGCVGMVHRARELAATWLARAEHASPDRAIAWFWLAAKQRADWANSVFGRVERDNYVIDEHRKDVVVRNAWAARIQNFPHEARTKRIFGGRVERRRQSWARRPPPPWVVMARTIRHGRTLWWLQVRKRAVARAAKDYRDTALPMGLELTFNPSPLLKYQGPAWVTGLLLLWWTGRLPAYDKNTTCLRCRQGHRSRRHIVDCHKIITRLRTVGFELRHRYNCRNHWLDRALQELRRFSLDDSRFRVIMAIFREMQFDDLKLNARRYRAANLSQPQPLSPERPRRQSVPHAG